MLLLIKYFKMLKWFQHIVTFEQRIPDLSLSPLGVRSTVSKIQARSSYSTVSVSLIRGTTSHAMKVFHPSFSLGSLMHNSIFALSAPLIWHDWMNRGWAIILQWLKLNLARCRVPSVMRAMVSTQANKREELEAAFLATINCGTMRIPKAIFKVNSAVRKCWIGSLLVGISLPVCGYAGSAMTHSPVYVSYHILGVCFFSFSFLLGRNVHSGYFTDQKFCWISPYPLFIPRPCDVCSFRTR